MIGSTSKSREKALARVRGRGDGAGAAHAPTAATGLGEPEPADKVAAGSNEDLARRASHFSLDPNVGTVLFDYDERIARTLAERSSNLGLSNIPVHYGKVLDLSIGLQHEELSNLVHSPTPIVRSEGLEPRGDDCESRD